MDHSSKHYFLRSLEGVKTENETFCELQEQNANIKSEFSCAITEEKNKLEEYSHFENLQSHIISSKDSIKDLTLAFAQKIEECEIVDEMLEKFQSKIITTETLLDAPIKENNTIIKKNKNRNPQNEMKRNYKTLSVENYAQKTEPSVKDNKSLKSKESNLEIQKKVDEKLKKDGISTNLEIPKTEKLQEVFFLGKTDTKSESIKSKFKMSDTKVKRKITNFVCPKKIKQESDDRNTNDKSIEEENLLKETFISKDQAEIKKSNRMEQKSQKNNVKRENISGKKNSIEPKVKEEVEINKQKIKKEKTAAVTCNDVFSDFFGTNIPLIGTKVIQNDEKPLTSRYDLAIEKNKRRFLFMKKEEELYKNGNSKKWETDGERSEREQKTSVNRKKREDLKMAYSMTKLCIQILQLLNEEIVNEKRIAKFLIKFISAPITPTSLLYVPHFIHTISLCRGSRSFSKQLRLIFNECYDKCHAMFPVPMGFNFESVYTAQVQKFLPDSFERLEDIVLDYGDISDIVERSDDERSIDDIKDEA